MFAKAGRFALSAAVAASVAVLIPGIAHAGWGQTPGNYASWSAPANPTSFTIPMTLQADPGDYNAYWSTQFEFAGVDASGYFGFQTHRDGGGMFLASVWNGVSGTAGSTGTYCKPFAEDGTGKTCRWDARPQLGHVYELTVARDSSGTGWTFTVDDRTTGVSTVLGTITLAGTATLEKNSFISWTEYYDWNNPNTVCADAKYSKMLFGIPSTDEGQGNYTNSWKSKTCQELSEVTVSPAGATEENGPRPLVPQVPQVPPAVTTGSLGS